LNTPRSAYYDGTRLFVADSLNHRVLIWNSFPTSSGQSANVVLGQPDFTSNTLNNGGLSASSLNSPQSVYSDGTQLFVTDTNNHRILRWQTIPTSNGAAADLVIGQINFVSNNNSTSTNGLSTPQQLLKSNNGKLIISDYGNHRLVYFNSTPLTNGANFDGIMGANSPINALSNYYGLSPWSFYFPYGIATDPISSDFWVTDYYNHRALRLDIGH